MYSCFHTERPDIILILILVLGVTRNAVFIILPVLEIFALVHTSKYALYIYMTPHLPTAPSLCVIYCEIGLFSRVPFT